MGEVNCFHEWEKDYWRGEDGTVTEYWTCLKCGWQSIHANLL